MNLHPCLSTVEHYRYPSFGCRAEKKLGADQQRVRYLPALECRHLRRASGRTEPFWVICLTKIRLLRGSSHRRWDRQAHHVVSGLNDHRLLELDGNGQLLSQELYYPFGGTALWIQRHSHSWDSKNQRYGGKERDVSGLYYYGFRYFSPWLLRWLNPDPAGNLDGLNLQCMCHNNPATFGDVDGRMTNPPDDNPGDGPRQQDEPPAHQRGIDPAPRQHRNAVPSAAPIQSALPSSASFAVQATNNIAALAGDTVPANSTMFSIGQWFSRHLISGSFGTVPDNRYRIAGRAGLTPIRQGNRLRSEPYPPLHTRPTLDLALRWRCPVSGCARVFRQLTDLQAHEREHIQYAASHSAPLLQPQQGQPRPFPRVCRYCQNAVSEEEWGRHHDGHDSIYQGACWACHHCLSIFTSIESLNKHPGCPEK